MHDPAAWHLNLDTHPEETSVPCAPSEPPQPSAAVTTRTCEQNGAIIVLNNTGGGTVTFTVLVDNEAFGTFDVSAGTQQSHLVPILEDQSRNILVTADGMDPLAVTRTRDCQPGSAASDEAEPAPTTPEPVVAGASDAPPPADPVTTAPAADPAPPTGILPFTGTPHLGWIAGAGLLLLFAGLVLSRRSWPDPRSRP